MGQCWSLDFIELAMNFAKYYDDEKYNKNIEYFYLENLCINLIFSLIKLVVIFLFYTEVF